MIFQQQKIMKESKNIIKKGKKKLPRRKVEMTLKLKRIGEYLETIEKWIRIITKHRGGQSNLR